MSSIIEGCAEIELINQKIAECYRKYPFWWQDRAPKRTQTPEQRRKRLERWRRNHGEQDNAEIGSWRTTARG